MSRAVWSYSSKSSQNSGFLFFFCFFFFFFRSSTWVGLVRPTQVEDSIQTERNPLGAVAPVLISCLTQ
uniref:Uncharacterized protein n=1 Tax=Rhizoctonia solani TaxID=456999 RepID=N0A5C2_9AGAM|nr:hypothetical protein RSOL_m01380 [Rhizoctonia solani]AGK45448.1 hypothetical protein RSOL_m01380 [Rhizoctonia solani]